MRSILLFGGLIGLFLGWNLPNHYPLWTTFHSELVTSVGVCLLFLGVLWPLAARPGGGKQQASNQATLRLSLPASAWAWVIVALLPIVQYLAGSLVFRGDAALGFMYALGAALSLYTGSLWAAQAGCAHALRVLFVTVVLGGLAAAGLALAQWVRLPTPGWWAMELISDRPYGNFAQPNLFGLLMVISIVAATALFEMRVLAHRVSYYLLVFVLGWAMLVCESRASLVALLTISACWWATRHRVSTRLRAREVLLGLGVGFAIYHALAPIEEALFLKAEVNREILDAGLRKWIWLHFVAAIIEHPWAGYGFGQGVAALREVATQVHPSRNTIYAHNFILDLMTWYGVPIGLALSAALGGWLLSWLRKTPDAELSAQRHWVFAVWLALVIQSLLEFPYAHTFFLFPAALLAGVVVGLPAKVSSRASVVRFTVSRFALAFAAIGMLLLVALTSDYLQLEDDFRFNRFARANFVDRPEHQPLVQPWVLDQLAALNATAQYRIGSHMPTKELAQLGVVARRFHLLPTRMDYAKALALNGRMPEAELELDMIRGIYDPKLYAEIERDWKAWLKENQAAVAAAQR